MLTVRNLPPEPTCKDWLKEELPLIKGLALWVTAMTCLAVLASQETRESWYLLRDADGVLIATPMTDKLVCRDRLGDENEACVSVAVQTSAEASLLSP